MNLKLFGLAILSGLLLGLAWPPLPFSPFLLFALLPLFIAEEKVIETKRKAGIYMAFLFISLLLWHLISHQWIFGLGKSSALGIMLIDSFLLMLFLLPAHWMKRAGHSKLGHVAFVTAWMSFDLLHLNWDLSFPLLNLGNGLARFPILIQWHEFTGVFGGSLWILTCNVLLFQVYKTYQATGKVRLIASPFLNLLMVIFLPILLSVFLYATYSENERDLEVVVVHPNINTRTERFITNQKELIDRYISISKAAITPETEYLVWTENAITEGSWIEHINEAPYLEMIRDSFVDFPQTKIIVGSILYKLYRNGKPSVLPVDVSFSEHVNQSYYTHIGAVQIDPGQNKILARTKQQLVPFEESAPYPSLLTWLRKLIGNFTGLTFSAAPMNQDVFYTEKNSQKITPLICYESAFGSNTSEYVKKGAQALFVLLNEGWYRDSRGAAQFQYFSVLRAIESRKSVARSSNDGISGFISPRGDIIEKQEEYNPTALRQAISTNSKITIYNRIGDIIGWLALLVGIGSYLYFLFTKLRNRQLSPKRKVSRSVKKKSAKKRNSKKKK